MLAQKLRGQPYEIFQSSGRLKGSGRCDDGQDNHHHVDGCLARSQTEAIDEDENSEHAINAKADATYTGTNKYQGNDDGEFYKNDCCCH